MAATPAGYGHLGRMSLDDQILGSLYDHRVVVRLFKYILPYKLWALLAFMGMAGYILTMVAQPLIIAWGINSFIVPPEDEAQWGSIQIVALVFLGNAAATMLFNYLQFFSLAALNAMQRALDEFRIEGLATTIPLHKQIFQHFHFRKGKVDTGFIEEYFMG